MNTEKITYGIVGSGWRSEVFLRIARELPDLFGVCGLVTRDEQTGVQLEKLWGIKTFRSVNALLNATEPGFIVASVAGHATASVITELVARKIPVLSETPPAPDLEQLIALNNLMHQGAKIQVAEQYHLSPMPAARISIANSGILGEINQAQVSFSHGYHGVSLMRKLLGITYENAEINGFRFTSSPVAGPGRAGLPEKETLRESSQDLVVFNFGKKIGIYDFEINQHRSYIRSQRILVRGNRGEIQNRRVKYLKDFRTPIEYELQRNNAGEEGNVEGYFLKGIYGGERWVYVNPFSPGKLSDDDIAVASCLKKMDVYVKGGPDFYSLAEASQDQYLSLMMDKAIITGEKVITEKQMWAV